MDHSIFPIDSSAVATGAVPVIVSATSVPNAISTTRVLHVINGEHYSGAERVQDLLALQLGKFGYEVGFACLKPDKFASVRKSQRTPLLELPMRHRFDWQVVDKLVDWIESNNYEMIHAHTPRTAVIGQLAARRLGLPLVYHVHSPASNDSTHRWANWLNALAERRSVRHAQRLICVSPSLQRHMIQRGFVADRVVCVPNGVPPLKGATERQAPGEQAVWTLGMVALFRPRKGLEVMLQALAILQSQGLAVRLHAVGPFETPQYESAIMCLVERLGIGDLIDWIGFTQNVPAELEKMDAFVLPSLFGEGLPMVVLEAMAAGLPIVATRVEGVPEAIVHRETGLLVEPDSVSQLSHAIEQLVTGTVDYTQLSRQALERHAERFSDAAMAEGVAKVYQQVLGEVARR